MDYLVLLLGFVGGITAIVGDTWRPEYRGIQKLTTTGRITLVIVVTATLVSVADTYEENKRLRLAQETAAKEIDRHLNSLIYPFATLLWDIDDKSYDYSIDTLKTLLDPVNIELIGEIDIRGKAPHYQGHYYDIISGSHNRGADGLDKVVRFYATTMDQEILTSIQTLATSYYYDSLSDLERYKPNERDYDDNGEQFPMPFRNISGTAINSDPWGAYKKHINEILTIKDQISKYLK